MASPLASETRPDRPHDTAMERPFVSIVMPALNEERYIAQAIRSILPDHSDIDCELLVMDGGSTDRTREIVSEFGREDARVRLVHNEGRLQSAGMNLAAQVADPRATFLVRADCHATYPPRYAARLIETMRTENASSVVVSMNTVGRTCMQKGIASAQNSRLGNGGSAHRLQGQRRFVDHGHHAAFDRQSFLRLGGYDAACAYNEDAEYDRRLIDMGGRIFLDGDIVIDYYPRDSLIKLARQYANYGWGRANTVLRHGTWPKARQILPVAILLACIAGLAGAFTVHPVALALPISYISAALAFGLFLAVKHRSVCALLSGPAAIVMHLSWGFGFLRRLAAELLRRVTRGGGGSSEAVGSGRRGRAARA